MTFSDAVSAMVAADFSDFSVIDGQNTYTRSEYEHKCNILPVSINERDTPQDDATLAEVVCKEECGPTTVFIDGSCIKNGANCTKGGFGVYWGADHPWNGSYTIPPEDGPTNNKAELRAAIKAIEVAQENCIGKLTINSDSKYVISGVTQWSDTWYKNGWKTSIGEPVKNKEEWVQLLKLINDCKISITWKHVPGHDGITGNEEADKLAVIGANNKVHDHKRAVESLTDNKAATGPLPKVIVVSKKPDHQQKDTSRTEEHHHSTPKAKLLQDNTDTSASGSTNGSSIDKKNVQESQKKENIQVKTSITVDSDQFIRIMKNMETVLETVLFEVNQSREENLKFKQDVSQKLEDITAQQLSITEALLTLPTKLSSEVHGFATDLKCAHDMTGKVTTDSTYTCKDILTTLINLQKNVTSRLDSLQTSLETVETSCSYLKKIEDKSSVTNKKEDENIRTMGRQLFQAIIEVRDESKRTREQVADMEKSISIIAEIDTFSTVSSKRTKNTVSSVTDSVSSEQQDSSESTTIDMDEDAEITYVKTVVSNTEDKQTTKKATDAGETYINSQPRTSEEQENKGEGGGSRKNKVCLIGDSVAGQVKVAQLGKSTNTFVRRIRSPKINDIGEHSEEIKGAKLILIHTGINNLRDKENTDSCIISLVKEINTLRQYAPEAKIAISKLTPVGDRELDIDRTIFNAGCEKKLREVHNDLIFIDNSNLAAQGIPIREFYKQDMLHLSYSGTIRFGNNLRRTILTLMRQKVSKGRPDGYRTGSYGYRARSDGYIAR